MSSNDAKFEEGQDGPLRLQALDADDLVALSALLQDAVLPINEISWQPAIRRFALLANRFRWEDRDAAERQKRDFERVQSMLVLSDVDQVSSTGVDMSDKDQVLSLMSLEFSEGDAPSGEVVMTFAGDGAISCRVECLDITLSDVTRPYLAPSKSAPHHDS